MTAISIGPRLKAVRKSRNIRAREVATATGLTPSAYSKVESGRYQTIQLDTLLRIASAIGCDVNELIVGANPSYDGQQAERVNGLSYDPPEPSLESYHREGPDYDLDVERAVLGRILYDPDSFAETELPGTQLEAFHFFREAHRRVFQAMRLLRYRGEPIDLISVRVALEGADLLDACGGPAYIACLVDDVPRNFNIRAGVSLVIAKWITRQMQIDAWHARWPR